MESDLEGPSRDAAIDALNVLSADKERLAGSVHVPWALMAAFGALGAWWVGAAATTNPGASFEAPSSSWLAVVGALVVTELVQRETGVRFRTMGAGAAVALIGIVFVNLLLFSVSLGLVSLGLHWAVVLTSAAAFAITTWLAATAYRSAVEKLRSE